VYVAAVLLGRDAQGWGWPAIFVALAASVIPFGTFYVERGMVQPYPAAEEQPGSAPRVQEGC
jgi:hypothetical protein